jgi:hypothetical protein
METFSLQVSEFLGAQPKSASKGRLLEIQEKLVDVLRGRPPSEQRDG